MNEPELPPAVPRLCYAPPQQIPHQPHVWYAPDWSGHHADTDPLAIGVWYCDGWARSASSFIGQRA